MDDAAYRARGLQIGSGSIESACKQLVTSRLKGAGMLWDEAGAEAVATVRASLKRGRWTEAMARRPLRQRPSVRQQPAPPTVNPLDMAAPEPAPKAAPELPTAVAPASCLPAAIRDQVQAELAAERATHPWRKPWSVRQQRRIATAQVT